MTLVRARGSLVVVALAAGCAPHAVDARVSDFADGTLAFAHYGLHFSVLLLGVHWRLPITDCVGVAACTSAEGWSDVRHDLSSLAP